LEKARQAAATSHVIGQGGHLIGRNGGPGHGSALHGGLAARHRPLDTVDRCDFKTIQKTCSLFGLDLVSCQLIFYLTRSFDRAMYCTVLKKGISPNYSLT
jgi:hypothetical protein